MNDQQKRLFFGVEVDAPWPMRLPPGRMLDERHRHMTLAFLGNIPYQALLDQLPSLPPPSFKVGPVGRFDQLLLLPKRHPNVAAWHVVWQRNNALEIFQKELAVWLQGNGYTIDERPWLPHVTLCRQPFDPRRWSHSFQPLPLATGPIHLYESLGNLSYQPIWSFPVRRPFTEVEHTADIAFEINGESFAQLYDSACAALAFKCPALLGFIDPAFTPASLEEVVIALNSLICTADGAVGCPMKAVSFHGGVTIIENVLYTWEMIVDV